MPQELAIYPDLSARENLRFFGAAVRARRRALARARVDEVLELIGLTDRADDRTSDLLGRHEAAAQHRHRPAAPPAPARPRRADGRRRPAEPQRDPRERRARSAPRAWRSSTRRTTWRRPSGCATGSGSSTSASSRPRARARSSSPSSAQHDRVRLEGSGELERAAARAVRRLPGVAGGERGATAARAHRRRRAERSLPELLRAATTRRLGPRRRGRRARPRGRLPAPDRQGAARLTMRTALLIAGKDLRQRMRDRSALLVAFVLPLVLASIFGLILHDVGSGSTSFHYALVDQDRGASARAFTHPRPGPARARRACWTCAMRAPSPRHGAWPIAAPSSAAIVIPRGFSAAVAGGRPARMVVLGNVDSAIGSLVADSIARSYGARIDGVRIATAAAGGSRRAASLAAAAERPIVIQDVSTQTQAARRDHLLRRRHGRLLPLLHRPAGGHEPARRAPRRNAGTDARGARAPTGRCSWASC